MRWRALASFSRNLSFTIQILSMMSWNRAGLWWDRSSRSSRTWFRSWSWPVLILWMSRRTQSWQQRGMFVFRLGLMLTDMFSRLEKTRLLCEFVLCVGDSGTCWTRKYWHSWPVVVKGTAFSYVLISIHSPCRQRTDCSRGLHLHLGIRFLQANVSSKKRTNEINFTTMRLVFVRFLEESEETKKHFKIIWPLVQLMKEWDSLINIHHVQGRHER